ncbi:hypothetical protein LENED_008155 [Lentinula edodes]|uniref:Uncharacterized protein n=1 Tax=Lentinula edodes TaxID=5353 RepID=A0A1Q3EGD3_LENED|nr:hypothetical protein LENED_008155 [Lentinula edodes]
MNSECAGDIAMINIYTLEPCESPFESLCESNSRYLKITSYWTYVHNMTLTSPSLNASILASSIPLHSDNVKYLAYEGDHTAVWDVRRKIIEEDEANHTEILFSTLKLQ